MKRVYKYPLRLTDEQHVTMPAGAQLLAVQMQRALVCLWALVDTNAADEQVTIRIAGTGHNIEEHVEYIDTLQMADGDLVWHVFKVTP